MAGWIVAEFHRLRGIGLISSEKMPLLNFSHATIPSRRGNPGPVWSLVGKDVAKETK
jgi:hypothetical protein